MSDTIRLHVRRVKDGDTLVCQAQNGDTVDVRVWGVDCPESSQPYGKAAENVAREVVGGDVVNIHVQDSDRYGRIIGRVQNGTTDLGRTLAHYGVAWYSRRYPTSDRLKELERKARKEERGLWSQEDPVPPWEYRGRGTPIDADGCGSSIAAGLSGVMLLVGLGALAGGSPIGGIVGLGLAALLFWAAKRTK